MMSTYVIPKRYTDAFSCPHCGVYAIQYWNQPLKKDKDHNTVAYEFYIGNCSRCDKITIWDNEDMIYPLSGSAPLANQDMPDVVKNDYNEARDIVSKSSRSACMLLRLCIEKICSEKSTKSGDLNAKIGDLVSNGLSQEISNALDAVRVIGNNAVHPLTMDLTDDKDTAVSLFNLVNYISSWAYTQKKEIDKIFDALPLNAKNSIQKRDQKGVVQST